MASESDIRRRASADNNSSAAAPSATANSKQQQSPLRSAQASDPPALDSVPESDPVRAATNPPSTPITNNARPSYSSQAASSAADLSDYATFPIQQGTPKSRRFSMLRFRNASDSQLAAKAKAFAAAEKPPPLPRRTSTASHIPIFFIPQAPPHPLHFSAPCSSLCKVLLPGCN